LRLINIPTACLVYIQEERRINAFNLLSSLKINMGSGSEEGKATRGWLFYLFLAKTVRFACASQAA
jgi:hypothetical protein